jgi:ribosomal protein S18 acetylase RimI-like enzyme
MVEVREATADDVMAVADVHVRGWQEGYRGLLAQDFLDGLSTEEWAGRFTFGAMDLSGPYTLVAVDGDAICGHVTIGRSRDDDMAGSAEIWAVYVDPRRWGGGIGRALIDAACERLAQSGYDRAFLWTLTANTQARRFYEQVGWHTDGRQRTILIGGHPADEVSYSTALPRRH